MPVRIPVYQERQTPSGFGVVPQARAPEVSDAIGRGLQRFGAAAEDAAVRVYNVQEKERQEFDTLRAEDAYNKLRERQVSLMMDPDKGFLARRGAAAIAPDVVPTYTNGFNAAVSEIEQSLTSNEQRQMFRRRAGNAEAEYRNALARHVLDQSNSYARSVYEGTLAVETDNATRDWQNPYTIQMSLERIDGAVQRETKRLGIVGDAAAAVLQDARSKVHSKVIMSALDAGNSAYAQAYLKHNAAQINAPDLLDLQGKVTKEFDARVAIGTATQVVQEKAPQAMPNDFQRLSALVERRESGSQGQAAVSPKGATGVMQVMPGTGPEAARLAGLPWDEKRFKTDADYNRRLGQAYLAKQLQDFGGDVGKALAAYNAGPGRVQDAVKRANRSVELAKNDPAVKQMTWLELLPKETRDYVGAILPQYVNGQGAPDRPTLQQVHDAVRTRVGMDNPQRLKLALDEATRQWTDLEKADKTREEQALDRAYKWLETNGGAYEAMPASLRSQIPGDKIGTVRDFATKISAGQPVKTNWEIYYPLRTDMSLLARTNLGALKGALGDAEFKELVKLQEDMKSGDAQTRVMNTSQRMTLRLNEAGVDPTPKPGSNDAKKVAQVYSMLDQNIRAAEVAAKRKLTPEELDKEVDRLFTQVPVKGVLFGTNDRRAYELQPTDQIVVPDADRNQIIAALKAARQPVTEERVLYYFKLAKGLQ
jgi:soluble lytic murein transglycosylase